MHKLVALIFAAGEGTGMNSSVAKYAHKICGQAMISYAIESTVEAGSDNIMIILGQNGDDIKEFLPENAVIADMTGTTGIWNAPFQEINPPCMLTYCKDFLLLHIYFSDILEANHNKTQEYPFFCYNLLSQASVLNNASIKNLC